MTSLSFPNLLILLTLLALQGGLAASLLAPVLDGLTSARQGRPPGGGAGLLAGILCMVLNLFVLYALQALPALRHPAGFTLQSAGFSLQSTEGPPLLILLGALCLYGVQLLAFQLWRPVVGPNGQAAAQVRRRLRLGLWLGLGVAAQVVFLLAAGDLLALEFSRRFHEAGGTIPLPYRPLAFSLALGALAGGGLWYAALTGCGLLRLTQTGSPSGYAGPQGLLARWVRRASLLLLGALVLRMLAVGFSLLLAAENSPLGPRHLFSITLEPAYPLLAVRLILGLVLPLMYALLIRDAVKRSLPREAALQFMPTLVLVAIGEIVAAGLTLGTWGVAF